MDNKMLNNLKNESNRELIDLMIDCNISEQIIVITLLGIGSHSEYYNVLYNRINNQRDNMNDETVKQLVVEILHEIDRFDDEE